MINKIILFSLICMDFTTSFAINFTRSPQGFLWYDEEKREVDRLKKDEEQQEETIEMQINRAKRENAKLRQDFDDAKELAIHDPTIENINRAKKLQKIIFEKSVNFGRAWQLDDLLNADIADIEENPNNLYRRILEQQKKHYQEEDLKLIARDFILIIYIKSGCEFCKYFAKILKELELRNSFKIFAISETGEDFEGFKGSINGDRLNDVNPLKLAPILYLVNKDSKILPVAKGLTDLNTVKQNILKIVELMKEQK